MSAALHKNAPRFSVVVPTYRRPEALAVCLRALANQTVPPVEVIVSYRSDDEETRHTIADLPPETRELIKEVLLSPGDNLARSLRTAISGSRGDLVALTDDDSEAPADWLASFVSHFTDSTVGAVGGRDLLSGREDERADTVGKVQWFGRIVGNHHAGRGEPRDVDLLKGVNCCFRGDLLRRLGVDGRLRGKGNVVHWEMAMCLPLQRAGWRLVYDPGLTLLHHVAACQDGDDSHRRGFDPQRLRDIVHNETFLLLSHLRPAGRMAFAVWSLLVGIRRCPGLAQLARLILTGTRPSTAASRWWATFVGRLAGTRTCLTSRRPTPELQPPPTENITQPGEPTSPDPAATGSLGPGISTPSRN